MSGDLIVEQHIHVIDMLDWFMGAHPVAALAFGGRARRKTGDQFDFFSTDFEYPGGVRMHSMCRQVSGCWNRGGLELLGEKGYSNAGGVVRDAGGKTLPLPALPWHDSPFIQEHVALLEGILKGQPVNETRNVTEATLAAIMARTSAYTGQRVTWDEMMKSDLALKPSAADFETGDVKAPPDDVVPVPGRD
jgi:predicted dehydrogenase